MEPKHFLSGITVEPLLFLTIASDMIYKLIVQNLYMEKACRVSLHMNSTTCDAMSRRDHRGYTNLEEIEVQKLSSGMMAIASALHGFFPVILGLFVGSWSDRKHKRKPVILAPSIGLLLSFLCSILNVVFFYELPIITTVMSDALFFPLFGGLPCLLLGVFSFIGSRSTDENKTVRIGAIATIVSASMVLGLGVSGPLFRYFGFIATFSLCAVLVSVGIVSGCLMIKDEPLQKDANYPVQEAESGRSFICDFFDLKYIRNTFRLCFGNNVNNRRCKVVSLMILGVVSSGPFNGELAVLYLYSRYKFSWNIMQYGGFSFCHCLTSSIASVLSVAVFSKYLKWEDATLGIIGIGSAIIGNIISALAITGEQFFLGGLIEGFNISVHTALRSMMAKTVPPHELGQINSLFGVFQAASNFICCPLYGLIYRNTMSFFPETFYIISVVVKLFGFCLFIFLYNDRMKIQEINAETRSDTGTL